ncbi:MAG: GNAT family N-acetyltransferase [Alphaproteobacteria bacterium]|nr:GNAT family N-acetyltransferase [Alphaproteobacteria bacterium]
MIFEKSIKCGNFSLEKLVASPKNAEHLLSVINDNRDFLGKYLEWVDSYTTTERALVNIRKSRKLDKCSYFIVIDKKIAGKIGFVDVDNNMGEISYWLAKEYNGHGIITNALLTLIQIGFDKMHLNRIQLTIDIDNVQSCAVAENCGFKCEGVLRKYFLLRGIPRDMKIYSIIK